MKHESSESGFNKMKIENSIFINLFIHLKLEWQ
jgi:hypothetical protein